MHTITYGYPGTNKVITNNRLRSTMDALDQNQSGKKLNRKRGLGKGCRYGELGVFNYVEHMPWTASRNSAIIFSWVSLHTS